MAELRRRERKWGSGAIPKGTGTSSDPLTLPGVTGADTSVGGGGYGTFWNPSSNWINSFTPQGGTYTPLEGRERCVDEHDNVIERFMDNQRIHKPSFSAAALANNAAIADLGREFWVKREVRKLGNAGRQTCRRNRYLAKDVLITNSYMPGPGFSDAWYLEDPRSKADPYGPIGWNRYSPTAPGGLGETIGELKETARLGVTTAVKLPKLIRGELEFFKGLGDQYLNVEFGWKPFLRSVREFLEIPYNVSKKVEQWIRDSGSGVRRSGRIDKVRESSFTKLNAVHLNPTGITYFQWNDGAHTRLVYQKSRDIWFSGRFRFFIPAIPGPSWKAHAIMEALGVNPTPGLVYDLLPWSWLIDWFSNVGDVIDNLSQSAEVDMTADYAYVMMHTTEKWSATAHRQYATGWISGSVPNPNPLSFRHATNSFFREEKIRVRANPFGFGTTIDSLSARQWAILAALGVALFPRTR